MKIFENRRLRGVISIFLIIIMVPTLLLSAVLIDGSRMISARAMAMEAGDLAAASVLSSYHLPLKDQFGLFALEDNEKVEAIYKESLNATLMAYGMSGDEDYTERLWEIMKTTLVGQKSYMGESFLNLYDFSVDQCKVEPMFCLAEQEVLENQMVEYAKFRGLYVMTDRMDILGNLDQIRKSAEQTKDGSKAMEELMEADENNSAADNELAALRAAVEKLNSCIEDADESPNDYFVALAAKMEQIRIENTDTEEELTDEVSRISRTYKTQQDNVKNAADTACKQAGKVLKQAEKTKKEVERAISRLEAFVAGHQNKADSNETVRGLVQDAEKNIGIYREEYLTRVQEILDDSVINKMKNDTNIKSELNDVMSEIHKAITAYMDTADRMRENDEEVTEYYYYYLNSRYKTQDADEAIFGTESLGSYMPAVARPMMYFIEKTWDSQQLNPSRQYEKSPSSQIDENFAKGQSEKSRNVETNLEGEAPKGEVPNEIYRTRPSRTYEPEKEPDIDNSFYNKDNDLTASKNIMKQGGDSILLKLGETARDDVLCLTYMFGTFKTRLTGVQKFSSEGMSDVDRNSFYMPKWRYAHPEGELDMRFSPKKDRDTVLRSEIEYLIFGNRKDAENETAAYAAIFAERMANNMLAMYGERKVVNPSCHVAAGSASLMTAGIVPEPVFFWMFLTAWATAETILEMDYLISGGYRIPLFKTPKNILLNKMPDGDQEGLISNYGEDAIFVSYEDYLMILLLITGRDKRIMRTADLVEMNMRKCGYADFTMANAYTYIHADVEVSIRHLFGGIKPFQSDYEAGGHSGRMKFNNTIYLGY